MGKKDKQVTIPEGKLVKAIAELENHFIEKGDALADADPEGGLGAEGTPLSAAVDKKTGVSKARSASSSSMSSDDDDAEKAMSTSDAKSSRAKSVHKGNAKSSIVHKGDDTSDAGSGDAEVEDDAEKSFGDVARDDETIGKAIDISPFLEAFVDQFSLALLSLSKTFQKSITDLESRLNARIDNRVAKSTSLLTEFNGKVAKALTAIGESINEQNDLVKSFGNQPAQPRGRAVLSKGQVETHNPPWQGGGGNHAAGSDGGDFAVQLADVPPEKIGDWLFAKSANNEIDPKLIMAWEADRYSIEALPEQVQKALVNDLCK